MWEVPAQLFFIVVLNFNVYTSAQSIKRGPEFCASLYTEKNLEGNEFLFRDEAQVLDFGEEHISADEVWNQTLSLSVTTGCQLTVCNETYLGGECQNFSRSVNELPPEFENFLSGSCECDKECKCSDIIMRRTSCARAYFKPGCNVCNPYYADLKGNKPYFPEEYHSKISAIKVRDGCSLVIYDEEEYEGNPINIDGTVEYWNGTIGSYECVCDLELSTPRPKLERPSSYPTFIDMPTSIENVSLLLSGDFAGHPGLIAAKRSLRNKRSSKNVYILTIGSTGAGKSSAINLLFDNSDVTAVGGETSTTKDIHEFRIPVPIDELGIGNSELRVIDTPGMGDTNGIGDDAKFLATLDDYLANHEELHNRIPNVVLIFHKFNDNRFSGPQSNFVKMLRGFDSLRKRITDKKFSNVIFVLSHFMAEVNKIRNKPNEKLGKFKAVIENYCQFPKPIMIVVAENKAADTNLPMVNGFYKLPNGDYYPRNLFDKIKFATSNGGDPIGEAVITTGFRDADEFNITSLNYRLVNPNDKRITQYRDILTKAVVEIEDTEISQLLTTSYEGMNSTLKKSYQGALYYLQKALSVRGIRNKSDVPKTTVEILTLVSSLKANEAITYLLENALNIKPPMFPHNVVTGYSFNVFKDVPLSKSPYILGEVINSDIGYLFPSAMTCNVVNQNQDYFQIQDSRAEYIKQRLTNLGIRGQLPEEKFTGAVKPGFNIKSESNLPDSCKVTAVREFRTFSLTLNDKPKLTPEFTEVLHKLPVFNESVLEDVKVWNDFFEKYGTHVVKHVHGGGAIEIELLSNRACDTNISQTLLGLVQFAEDLTALTNESKAALAGGDIRHQLTFKGGNQAYHTSDLTQLSLDESFELMQNWKESLQLNPTILTTEMQLLPMSEVVRKVGQNISSEILRATSLLFNSSLAYVPPPKPKESLPGNSRETTALPDGFNSALSTMVQALVSQSKSAEEKFALIISKLTEEQKASELRRQETQKEHLQWLERQEKTRLETLKAEKEEREKKEEERLRLAQEHTKQMKEEQEAAERRREAAQKAHFEWLEKQENARLEALKEAKAERERQDRIRDEQYKAQLEKMRLDQLAAEARREELQREQNAFLERQEKARLENLKLEREERDRKEKIREEEFKAQLEKARLDQEAAEARREEALKAQIALQERQEKARLDALKLLKEENDRQNKIREQQLKDQMEKMERDQAAAEARRVAAEKATKELFERQEAQRKWEKQQEAERLEKLKLEQLEYQKRMQVEEQKRQAAEIERRGQIERARELERKKREQEQRDRWIREQTPTPKPPSCLQKGTLILLADGSEKPVEEVQIGDLLMDHDMNPTRVLGQSSEFLLGETFYGFDNNSFFFTNTHILVGPGYEVSNDQKSLQLYVQNKERLLRQNPLMNYIGIEQITRENFNIYHFDKISQNMAPKLVKVYKDPKVHPVDTMVYFIQVDNPAGTYFANGYVCRHEIPPVEFWPNTMAILFSLHTNPEFMSFGNVPYTLTSLSFIHDVVTEVKFKIEDTLNLFSIQDLNTEDPVIKLDSRNSEIVINSIFNHPSFSVFGMGLYNQVGLVMSRYLDDCRVNNCVPTEYLGSLQKLLANEISKQISKSVKSKI